MSEYLEAREADALPYKVLTVHSEDELQAWLYEHRDTHRPILLSSWLGNIGVQHTLVLQRIQTAGAPKKKRTAKKARRLRASLADVEDHLAENPQGVD